MTDNDIIKALECCRCDDEDLSNCGDCPLGHYANLFVCHTKLSNYALSLINRQRAEIERLQGAVQEWVDGKCLSQKYLLMIGKLQNEIEQVKAEAIKEFAERLKSVVAIHNGDMWSKYEYIDNLVKEMVGEDNA